MEGGSLARTCFSEGWAVPALEMSSVQVKVEPSCGDFLLYV